MTRYCVQITYEKGHSYLFHRGRTEWSRRQAQRHAKDCRALMAAGKRPGWVAVRVLEC